VHKWIVTCAQVKLDLEHPELFNWDIEVIAHSLAHINRYTGHAPWAYSVAQHACHIADYLYGLTGDAMVAFQGLHHDDAEIVTGDMSSPMKRWLKDYTNAFSEYSHYLDRVIAKKLGLKFPFDPRVREADTRIALNEKNTFFPALPDKWQSEQEGCQPIPDLVIDRWTTDYAKARFIETHQKLKEQIHAAS
jgi:5'-nucleotidase